MKYNTLIDHQQDLPVETVLILLRPKAAASDQTGMYSRRGPAGNVIAEFRYHVERVWERPADFWLSGGVNLAPLALLTDEAAGDLETALARFRERLRDHGADETISKSLLGSSFVLCGLRYTRERTEELFRSASMLMEESTTYQGILEKGHEKGLAEGRAKGLAQGEQKVLLRLGTKRFGLPTAAVVAALEAITDTARLEQMTDHILDVTSWDDLLRAG